VTASTTLSRTVAAGGIATQKTTQSGWINPSQYQPRAGEMASSDIHVVAGSYGHVLFGYDITIPSAEGVREWGVCTCVCQ
jgi:hypothetical protein